MALALASRHTPRRAQARTQAADLDDADGNPPIRSPIDLVESQREGWAEDLRFRNPVTDTIKTRVNACEHLGEFAVCSGTFLG